MIPALNSALSGLQLASQRLEDAAANVARAGATAAAPDDASAPAAPTSSAPVGPGASVLAAQETPSLVSDLISAKEAEILYKASAKLVGVIADTQSELLDIEA